MSSLDLALIGNCQIGALLDRRGRMVWSCMPRFDGDPVFCSLLDGSSNPEHGYYDVELADLAHCEQRYVPNTAVVETVLRDTAGGALKIIDFAPRFQQHGRFFRPMMLVRTLVPIAGKPRVRVRLRPRGDYGAVAPILTHGSNHIRYVLPGIALRLTTDVPITAVLEERTFVLDRSVALLLGSDETLADSPNTLAQNFLNETCHYWEGWVHGLSIPFEWQEAVIRAAITLKLCTFEDTGAVIAAVTTSIPEAAGSGRNWDYRYCWLRDAYFVVQALNKLGATVTMEQYLRYIINVATEVDGRDLQPVYGISGACDLSERIVPSLTGYRAMGPVRVGNQAFEQRQNDVYGAVVLAAMQYFFDRRFVARGDAVLFRRLERLGERAAASYDSPDAGLWEYRGRQRVHTFSSVMCWAACDRLSRIAEHLQLPDRAKHWRDTAKAMHADIARKAWSSTLWAFTESFGRDDLDASMLLLHNLGFVRADDSRFDSTVRAIGRDLVRGSHMRRYALPDDFGAPENSFNVCTFWYIEALAATGRTTEAREIFENLLACRTPLGLLSEDIDPATNELWGNFPQTYSMVGIINCAMRLSKTWGRRSMNRVVVVSNRTADAKQSGSNGGLAVGVLGALERGGGLWFGWSAQLTPGDSSSPRVRTRRGITYATFDLNEQLFELYYNGFCNNTLWPLFHYRLGFFEYDRVQYTAYLDVNAVFVRGLAPLLKPGDIVWVHDLHLIPLGAMLRASGVDAPLGFFLHTPFPSFEVLRALPVWFELVAALCAYDVVGFQTSRDLAAFLEAVVRPEVGAEVSRDQVRYAGRTLRVGVFPIGIDVPGCAELARADQGSRRLDAIKTSLSGRRLLIGVDRLDYSKGLPRRFHAYERLLDLHPTNRREVVFMQIAPPTRAGVRAYTDIRHELEQAAGHINGKFADVDWAPLRYLNRSLDRQSLMALFRLARVGLVTPIRDGMNLVAKEYVAAQDPTDPGVLVLSTMAGSAEELEDAVLVNPYDADAVAEGIHRGLTMPLEERRRRHAAMMAVLARNDIYAWRTGFVSALAGVSSATAN